MKQIKWRDYEKSNNNEEGMKRGMQAGRLLQKQQD